MVPPEFQLWWPAECSATALYSLQPAYLSLGGTAASGTDKKNHLSREVIERLGLQVMVPPEHKLWWPAGYGTPALYDLHVAYLPSEAGGRFTTTQIRVGFRSIRLVQARRLPSRHNILQ